MKKKGIDLNLVNLEAGLRKNKPQVPIEVKKAPQNLSFYDVSTGKPLSLEILRENIRHLCSKIERNSSEILGLLYFIDRNREYYGIRNYPEWVRNNTPVSYSYMKDICKAVDTLRDMYRLPSEKEGKIIPILPDKIAAAIEKIGMMRLKNVSQVRDPKRKKAILDDLLNDIDHTPEEILQENKTSGPGLKTTRIVTPEDKFHAFQKVIWPVYDADEGLEIIAVDFGDKTLKLKGTDGLINMSECRWPE